MYRLRIMRDRIEIGIPEKWLYWSRNLMTWKRRTDRLYVSLVSIDYKTYDVFVDCRNSLSIEWENFDRDLVSFALSSFQLCCIWLMTIWLDEKSIDWSSRELLSVILSNFSRVLSAYWSDTYNRENSNERSNLPWCDRLSVD